MIPFDDTPAECTPATRVALTRALLKNGSGACAPVPMYGGGKQPPPDYPPVTYANGDDACSQPSNESSLIASATASAIAQAGIKPDATIARSKRPSIADDIDRIVAQLVADGEVRLVNDAYVGTRGAHWRWRYET